MTSTPISARISETAKGNLQVLSQRSGKTVSAIIAEYVEAGAQDDMDRLTTIEQGLAQATRKEYISEQAIDEWMQAWVDGEDRDFPQPNV